MDQGTVERQEDLGELLAAARGMAEGQFHKIQRLTALVGDIESRLVQILVLFHLDEVGPVEGASDPILAGCLLSDAAKFSQDHIDQLLSGFASKPPSG